MHAFLHQPGSNRRMTEGTTSRRAILLHFCLILLAAMGLRQVAAAQRIDFDQWPMQPLADTVAPLLPIYGFNGDEFSIGAYVGVKPDPARPQWSTIWDFLDSLGIRVLESRVGTVWERNDDTLADLADGWDPVNHRWRHVMIVNQYPHDQVGHAKSMQFFPFDSAESFYWPCKFLSLAKGRIEYNPTTLFGGRWQMRERIYDITNTTPNDTILKQITMGYDAPREKYRYHPGTANALDSVQQGTYPLWSDVAEGLRGHHLYIGVMVHLFDSTNAQTFVGPVANMADTLLVIEIWNEIPKETTWLDSSGSTMSDASNNREFLYKRIPIRKADLLPVALPGKPIDWNAYRTPLAELDMIRDSATGFGGPWNDANNAHRFDLRVRWTGREMLALRSLIIRDELGRLAFGDDSVSIRYRDTIFRMAEMQMRGPDYNDTTGSIFAFDTARARRLDKIIRFYSGDEPQNARYGGFNFLDSTLYRIYHNPNLQGRDTLTRGARAWHSLIGTNPSNFLMTSQQEIPVETYLFGNSHNDGSIEWDFGPKYMGLPRHINQIPSLPEHNGGSYTIPTLTVAPGTGSPRDSVEIFARALNRLGYGAYSPGGNVGWPYDKPMHFLGTAAWVSRRTGRRIIQYVGVQHLLYLTWAPDFLSGNYRRVTVYSHQPEASEIRLSVNLGLCYGSRGIHYSFLGGTPNNYSDPVRKDTAFWAGADSLDHVYGRNYIMDVGPVGFTLADTLDIYPELRLGTTWHPNAKQYDTLRNFWTGWSTLPKEIAWIDRSWIPRIDSTLRGLHWRDGYSIHFTVPQTYYESFKAATQATSRPLPATEIVRGVEAYDRWGHKDSAMNTFAELGLFDAKKGASALEDTNYIFVVNRRTFERPVEVPAASARGRLMDSLAEIRRLRIGFRLKHPDSTQYNFVRVREVTPDTEPMLKSVAVPRIGLDTVIRGDSAIDLALRPGGAALLEITYCKPDDSLAVGDIRFNNQRKLLFDGRYWHAVFFRDYSFKYPPALVTPVTSSQIYYRRSLPVDSSLGAIRWDPRTEAIIMVSDTLDVVHCIDNRFPSITLRADSSNPGRRVVTVVWTSYTNAPGAPGHDVLTRKILVPDSVDDMPTMGPVEIVGFARGRIDSAWGTPVVSRLHGGEIIAWSDSTAGIIARFRRLDTAGWSNAGIYSGFDSVSYPYVIVNGGLPSQYPSMPPFAHVKGRDSSIAIAWQQQVFSTGPIAYQIRYARLIDSVDTSSGTHHIAERNHMAISPADGWRHMHPSIDMTQDVWFGAQEGVTWESWTTALNKGVTEVKGRVHFSSLWTETTRGYDPAWQWRDTNNVLQTGGNWRPYYDSIEQAWQWTLNSMNVVSTAPMNFMYSYPSTASLNARIDTNHATDSIYFAIALARTQSFLMRQTPVQYATSFLWSQPQQYLYGGYNPSTSASLIRQSERQSVLYAEGTSASKLETTRQFFAKARPRGYMAYGRIVHFPIDDPAHTALSGALHDVWYAGEAGSGWLRLIERPDSRRRTDSLDDVRHLFRTGYFHAHDSTTIGCELWGRFVGDTALASGMRVAFIAELVDSATDRTVALLDSFCIAPGLDSHEVALETAHDLLSGTYYVRLRLEPVNLIVADDPWQSRYPVEEYASYVDEELLGRVRRLEGRTAMQGVAGPGRIIAQPNPVNDVTEIRFSVPTACHVSLSVFNQAGMEVRRLVDGAMMEAGRYAVDLDASDLPVGSYLVQLQWGANHAVEKIVVRR